MAKVTREELDDYIKNYFEIYLKNQLLSDARIEMLNSSMFNLTHRKACEAYNNLYLLEHKIDAILKFFDAELVENKDKYTMQSKIK